MAALRSCNHVLDCAIGKDYCWKVLANEPKRRKMILMDKSLRKPRGVSWYRHVKLNSFRLEVKFRIYVPEILGQRFECEFDEEEAIFSRSFGLTCVNGDGFGPYFPLQWLEGSKSKVLCSFDCYMFWATAQVDYVSSSEKFLLEVDKTLSIDTRPVDYNGWYTPHGCEWVKSNNGNSVYYLISRLGSKMQVYSFCYSPRIDIRTTRDEMRQGITVPTRELLSR